MNVKTGTGNSNINRLYRSDENKIIGGVSAGLGEYFHTDATIIRILFVIAAFFGGSGVIFYLILWTVVPSRSFLSKKSSDAIRGNIEEMKAKAKSTARQFNSDGGGINRSLLAFVLLGVGVLLLVDKFNIFRIDFGNLWPILLILLGILILRKR